jgi:hypothetical protein
VKSRFYGLSEVEAIEGTQNDGGLCYRIKEDFILDIVIIQLLHLDAVGWYVDFQTT